MTDCEHCSETFEDDAAYLRHLDAEHPDEMGRIERRRLEDLGGSSDGPSMPLLVGGIAVGALLLAIVIYTVTTSGGQNLGPAPNPPGHELGPAGDDQTIQPQQVGSAHTHGQISVTVDGTEIDFRRAEFQHPQQMVAFHFEAGERRWHGHARQISLEYALEATAFGVTNDSFAYDGTVYRTGSNASAPDGWEVVTDATVVYVVNGERVDPETYVLEDGDSITVHVEAPGGDGGGSANETTTNGIAASGSPSTTPAALA
ncbi:hypothetical protein G9C85_11085 [Halorubellus sp. JP-L1]|uniref:hypothetical protein n=1 Tax=Halorubellus sp. JP-L1 TaxID=2715753 RepID=UPI00140C15A9|nr:hypothetical protein [Halorubellus sp. JP-L1]NHN42166.1 hypothetical protein [Halorubellus sp. JP-L1]